jgi:hypothetical protein
MLVTPMPIIVVCPGCGTKLNAPDTAAGKRVRCPKPDCGTAVAVPAPVAEFEAVDEQTPAKPKKAVAEVDEDTPKKPKKAAAVEADDEDDAPKRPKKKPARAEADDEDEDRPVKKKRRVWEDDEDEDEDDRPTRKRKKQKSGGISPAVIAVIAVVGLLVLGGVGYGIYALTKKNDDTAGSSGSSGSSGSGSNTPEKPKGKVPDAWVEYKSDQDKFRMTMPKTVKKTNPKGTGNQYEAVDAGVWLMAMVYVVEVPPGITPAQRKELEANLFSAVQPKNDAKMERRRVSYQGKMVDEIIMDIPNNRKGDVADFKPKMIMRGVPAETKIYLVCVAPLKGPEQLNDVEAIFDTFQVIK